MSRGRWLTVNEQIAHCKDKGITFIDYSEEKAKKYLSTHNTFFRLRSYRKNFVKNNEGKYINLDFSQLVDLSIIDYELRRILLDMTLNIEHYTKINLVNYIGLRKAGDAYHLIKNFLGMNLDIQKSIESKRRNIYDEDLYAKYGNPNRMPIWVFVEFITFSELIQLIKYTAGYFNDKRFAKNANQLFDIKAVRNACAHDICILNDIAHSNRSTKVSNLLSAALGKIGIKESRRKSKLAKIRLSQIASVLFFHKRIVNSTGVDRQISEQLQYIKNRFFREHTYNKNLSLQSTFQFLSDIIDNSYKIV